MKRFDRDGAEHVNGIYCNYEDVKRLENSLKMRDHSLELNRKQLLLSENIQINNEEIIKGLHALLIESYGCLIFEASGVYKRMRDKADAYLKELG
jgi:hypothetical protein